MTRARQRTLRIPWKASDVKALRRLAGKQDVRAITRKLRRTESAIWQRARVLKLSLRRP